MNEFENKLRGLPFREPPDDLRRRVLAAAQAPEKETPAWTWRDWLWPAPLAWATLAIMLVAALTADAWIGVAPQQKAVAIAPQAPSPTLFAFHSRDRQVALLETLH